jgi:hypothetical protein
MRLTRVGQDLEKIGSPRSFVPLGIIHPKRTCQMTEIDRQPLAHSRVLRVLHGAANFDEQVDRVLAFRR